MDSAIAWRVQGGRGTAECCELQPKKLARLLLYGTRITGGCWEQAQADQLLNEYNTRVCTCVYVYTRVCTSMNELTKCTSGRSTAREDPGPSVGNFAGQALPPLTCTLHCLHNARHVTDGGTPLLLEYSYVVASLGGGLTRLSLKF